VYFKHERILANYIFSEEWVITREKKMKRVIITTVAIVTLTATVFVACENDDPLPVKGGPAAAASGTSGRGQVSAAATTNTNQVDAYGIVTPDGDIEVVGQPYGVPVAPGGTTPAGSGVETAESNSGLSGSTPSSNITENQRGFVNFTVNGLAFSGTTFSARFDNGVFTLKANASGQNFPFVNLNALVGEATEGTFSSSSGASNSGVFTEFPGSHDVVFTSTNAGGTATIIFSSINRNSASGNFSFTGISLSGEQRNANGDFQVFFN
jgi:hypothetical protein